MSGRGAATRARLIEATRAIVRETGYAHASTRAIAERAGVAEGTIYRHFPDKTSLFFAAATEPNGQSFEALTGLPGRAGQGSVEDNLVEAMGAVAAIRDEIIPLELAILADPELMEQRRSMLASLGGRPPGPPQAVAAYLEAEQRLGRVRADVDPMDASVVLFATLFGLAVSTGVTDTGLAAPDPRTAIRVLVRGLASEDAGRTRP